jgi:hypothetical protein
MRCMLLGMLAALALVGAAAADPLTWGSVVTRAAGSCDAFTPVLYPPDGHHYTSYGDCVGFDGTGIKLSMGFGRIIGGPANATVRDLPTPDLSFTGDRDGGKKPSSALIVGSRMYIWLRNYGPNGTQSKLKYSDNFTLTSNSTWKWSPFQFYNISYPVFLQGALGVSGGYVYMVFHDGTSAYTPANRFALMRAPASKLLERSAYEFFSGTPASPSWSKSYEERKSIFTAPGKCFRSGMTYSSARARYYWWQNNGDSKRTGSFEVWSGPRPWGPWTRIFFTPKWDVNPGERGEFPVDWMGSAGINLPGTMYLVYSGDDRLNIRRATVAAGY